MGSGGIVIGVGRRGGVSVVKVVVVVVLMRVDEFCSGSKHLLLFGQKSSTDKEKKLDVII